MMKRIQILIAAFIVSAGIGAAAFAPASYAASCSSPKDCAQDGVDEASGGGGSTADVEDIIELIVKVLLYIIGAVSVIMIIIGGIKYTVSNGDSSAVTSAKNTILYSVIGLLVAIFAYAIVSFVVSKF